MATIISISAHQGIDILIKENIGIIPNIEGQYDVRVRRWYQLAVLMKNRYHIRRQGRRSINCTTSYDIFFQFTPMKILTLQKNTNN